MKCAMAPASTFPSEFPTPGVRTIDDLANFAGGAAAESQIKTLVYVEPGTGRLIISRYCAEIINSMKQN